jgi:DNA-binding response OmpR family regulator
MQYRVFFADRNPIIQTLVEDILQREGFEVKIASDGETVIQEFHDFKPHIILADISLRGIDGYCLCKEIKEKTPNSNIPVILLAGAYEPYDGEYARLVGADDHILKPFESLELVGKIRKLLNFEYSDAYEPPSYSDDAFSAQPVKTTVNEDSGRETLSPANEMNIVTKEIKAPEFATSIEIKQEQTLMPPKIVKDESGNRIDSSGQIDNEELRDLVIESLDALIAYQFKTAVSEELSSSLRERIRTTLHEIGPAIVEEILKEKITSAISSLMEEIEAEIKNALPGIVKTIIRRKFEKGQ